MKLYQKYLVLSLVLMLAGISAVAQTTASLNGTVASEGSALPGVTVTISSPALQGTRTTYTGENGGYFFGALPPGRYTVTFELTGMQFLSRTVDIGVAQTGRADADLKVEAMAEAITVTASAPSVLETPQVATNVDSSLVETLPIGRNVVATALLAPGVTGNTLSANQLQISGSPGYDNLVMVNGVAITESVRSQALGLFIEDAIQETTVLTGSVSAEYGRFTGGVVNSITKSGGNEFTGSFRDSLTNPSWSQKTPWASQPDPIDKINNIYEETLGGFLMRDRLWFFAAGRQAETSTENFTRPVPGDPDKTTQKFVTLTKNDRYEGKLTGQFTDKHNAVVSYLDVKGEQTNGRFTALSYDLDSLTDRKDPQHLLSVFYNGILTSNLLVEARYSEMEYGIGHGSGSKYTDFVRGTIVRNRADSNSRYNSPTFCGVCDKEFRNNDGYVLKGSYFLSSRALGNHSLVAGIENFSEYRYANNFQSGSNFRLFVNSVQRVGDKLYPTLNPGPGGSAAYLVWTPIFTGANENDFSTDSIFINDKWDLNSHWSFNVGFRFDKNDAVDGNGTKVSDDSRVSPRLTAIYDVKGDGRYRVTGSYNEYVSRIVEGPGTSAQSAGSPGYIEFAYMGPAINPSGTPVDQLVDTHAALQIVYDWFMSQGGTDNLSLLRKGGFRDVPGYSSIISDTLASPYVQEVTLGYGMQIGSNAFVKIDGIMRNWKDFYAFRIDQTTPKVTDFLGIEHDVSVVENTNDIEREYQGIQLQAAWRPNRFTFGGNYTWSTLEGNDEQESTFSGTVGNNPGGIYYAELLNYARMQPTGYLTGDQRHRLRAWVAYDVPIPEAFGQVNVSLLQNFDSGQPYSAVGSIRVQGAGTGAPTNLGYAAAPGTGQYYFSDRGAFRLDDVISTDLSLNYTFPKLWKASLYAQGELLNIFDNDTVDTVNQSVLASGNSSNFAAFNPFTTNPADLIECPQGTPGAQCKAMGAHWQKGANFGNPTGPAHYQDPRTYRFSLGVRF